MRSIAFAFVATFLVGACASSPRQDAATPSTAQLTPASYSTSTATPQPESSVAVPVSDDDVCKPRIIDRRAALKDDCLNRIERSPTAGKGYNAIGREPKHQLKSMCDYSVLPKCRRKY
ncbi:MAG: hypothetical protein R3200_00165 [Xanthomonadales bacterium]|nr:hypothetical protein [Xanthomonadales bacterium]